MKDETKHFLARQIAFAVPLILFGWLVLLPLVLILTEYRPWHSTISNWVDMLTLNESESVAGWIIAFLPLVIGYCYKLFKWVMKWK